MPKSACLKCHRLIPMGQTYCTTHTRKPRPRVRPSKTKRGLGYTYEKNRGIALSISRGCVLCGLPGANSADHVVPRSQGGTEELFNLAPAHLSCNSSRKAKPLTLEQRKRLETYRALLRAGGYG